jgi:hypothetical protein
MQIGEGIENQLMTIGLGGKKTSETQICKNHISMLLSLRMGYTNSSLQLSM